jgi:hypothetical protein
MRNLAIVTISLIAVLALLDVAAALVINGSIDVPPLLILVVVVAGIAQLVNRGKAADTRDVMTLVRLRLQAAALARHTAVLTGQERGSLGMGEGLPIEPGAS